MPQVAARTADPANVTVKPRKRTITTTETIEDSPHLPGMEPPKEAKPGFWDFMASTTEEEWGRRNIVANLFRIDPRRPGKLAKGFLEKLYKPFTLEQIKERWGGCDFERGIQGNYLAWTNEGSHILYAS